MSPGDSEHNDPAESIGIKKEGIDYFNLIFT